MFCDYFTESLWLDKKLYLMHLNLIKLDDKTKKGHEMRGNFKFNQDSNFYLRLRYVLQKVLKSL